MIKILFVNFIVLIFGMVTILLPFEFYLRFNLERYHSYGWVKNNKIEELAVNCNDNKKLVGIFGDSFVEYYFGKDQNLVSIIDSLDSTIKACNFGVSGSGIDAYFSRFKYVNSKINLNTAVVYLYEGNDFFEVKKTDLRTMPDDFDRNNNFVFNLLKQSSALNFIWREIVKKYFFYGNIKIRDFDFEICGIDPAAADKKLKLMKLKNPSLYQEFYSDQLNSAWLQVSLNCPNYFKLISQSEINFDKNYSLITDYIIEMEKMAAESKVKLAFVIIPHDYFLSATNKRYWENIFQFDHVNYLGKTLISKKLISEFDNVYYADTLEGTDYINLDGHLKPSGNMKLATYTNKLISR